MRIKSPRVLAQGVVSRPKVSADGKVVIWNQLVGEKKELMRYKDGEVVNLSDSPHTHDTDADLNFDGSVIAWKRLYDDGSALMVSKDGIEKSVDGFPGRLGRLAVSDDGSTVVYDENTQGEMAWNIRRYRDGKIEQVTDNKKFDAFPIVSGDGSRIVYTRYDNKNLLMLKDGDAEPKVIVDRKSGAVEPEISANGETLIWSERLDGDFNLHQRDLVSGKVSTLVAEEGVYEKQPSLASETGEIAYTGYDFRNGRPAETNVFLHSQGAELQQLSETQNGRNGFPDISENGESVVWLWTDRENRENRKVYLLER